MKIGIVNDMLTAVQSIKHILSSAPSLQVIWVAHNGAEAVKYCAKEVPDLILMDLMMPVMDGVEATRRIMNDTPCAILVVTATVTGHTSKVFEAMGAGALDAVPTPIIGASDSKVGEELLAKIGRIANLLGIPQKASKRSGLSAGKATDKDDGSLVVLGCSTGGPNALLQVLSSIPENFPAAFVVIQHMDEKFTPGLVTWMDNQLKLPVRLINKGDRPQPGKIMFACTDHHLVMTDRAMMKYSVEPIENCYHPSVDVFFSSVAEHWHGDVVGTLLTGMGRDGAKGLLALRQRGWHTIAQDRESSVVYGMPKAAVELDAAVEVLPIDQIGPSIIEKLTTRRSK